MDPRPSSACSGNRAGGGRVQWAVHRVRKAIVPIVLAAVIGCGGSGVVSNGARLRFFDALSDTGNVRLYVGGKLYSAGGVGPAIKFGDEVAYGNVPAGTVSLYVNPYSDLSSGGDSKSLASLTSQTLVAGKSYTAVALISGTTKRLVLYADNTSLASDGVYIRIINGSTTVTPLYLYLERKSDGSYAYQTELESGDDSSLVSVSSSATSAEDYVLHAYRDADLSDEIASTTLSLAPGKATTTFLYNRKSGSGVSFRSALDRNPVSTSTTTTTSTTGTTVTTASTGTTSTTGTTATTDSTTG